MQNNIPETVTAKIKEAFDGETKAIVSYYVCAQIARDEGREDAAKLFELMAKNELEHAKVWYNYLYDDAATTDENLARAAANENYEWKHMYPEFARFALNEGAPEIADMFERIASIECEHERRFVEAEASETIKTQVEADDEDLVHCLFCGYPSGTKLEICPVCGANNSFIE